MEAGTGEPLLNLMFMPLLFNMDKYFCGLPLSGDTILFNDIKCLPEFVVEKSVTGYKLRRNCTVLADTELVSFAIHRP